MSEAECKDKKKSFGVDNVILNFIFDSCHLLVLEKKYHWVSTFFSSINMSFRVVMKNKVSEKCLAESLV